MSKSLPIQATPPNLGSQPDVEFRKNDFEGLIWKKGYRVIFEKALKCPCKSQATNMQSNCKNCGGIGWIYVNPLETRAILSSMNRSTQYKDWSEELLGTVNITMRDSEKLSYRDKITVLDSDAYFTEVVFFDEVSTGELIAFTTYRVKSIEYAGMFVGVNNKLQQIPTSDITIQENILQLSSIYLSQLSIPFNGQGIAITLRYKHSPEYYVVDLSREVMNTFVLKDGRERSIKMPISAIGRRSHYVVDSENLYKTRLLNNDYQEPCDEKDNCI